MNTTLDPSLQRFLANIATVQQQLAQASAQISSGKKITQASDAPDQIDTLLQLRADRQHNQQIQSNLTLAGTDAQAADGALGSAIQLMDRAVQLGTEGANSTTSATALDSLAQEVGSLMDQMVSYSQTVVQGRYIFSGDQPGSPTYQRDTGAAAGVDQLSNAPATARIENPAGGTIQAVLNAQQIFDVQDADGNPLPGNVFAALSGLQAALGTGDPDTVAQAVDAVKTASTYLNSQQAFYGEAENRIQSAQSFATAYDTQLKTQTGDIEDADIASAALQLTQSQSQLQASFQMQAAIPRKSLFDYMG